MDPDMPNKPRRAVVGGIATGLLASVIAPHADALSTPAGAPAGLPPNPKTAYPPPPFPAQQQA